MKQYNELISKILAEGTLLSNRTGIDTLSIFGVQMKFDLNEGFPAVTTKKLAWKAVVGELLWFLEGSHNERRLAELTHMKPRENLKDKQTIWTANANAQGIALGYRNDDNVKELGPVYGHQWRNFGSDIESQGFDQISWLINEIKTNPDSRRLILNSWSAGQISEMALPPCHVMVNFRVVNNKLSCLFYMRSWDVGLGAPFNIASYALLTHLIARECNLGVGELVVCAADAHIYVNHIDQLKEQLSRTLYNLPILKIDETFDLGKHLKYKFEIDSGNKITLENYVYHPTIQMDMAV